MVLETSNFNNMATKKNGCISVCLAGAGALLSTAYLSNLGAGVIEFIPDNIPGVGNIDEALATALLIYCLNTLGLNPMSKSKMSNKSRLDNRP